VDKDKEELTPEQREHNYLLKVREEIQGLLAHPGWKHRSLIFNDLREEQGRLLEGAIDGFQLYRAQGALKVLASLQNQIIDASNYEEEKNV